VNILILLGVLPPKNYAVGYDRMYIKKLTFLKLSLTMLVLQLLLH